MSGTNAIHGIVVLGGILLLVEGRCRRRSQQAAAGHRGRLRHDQRRRRLPGHRPDARDVQEQAQGADRGRRRRQAVITGVDFITDPDFRAVLYIVSFSLFIYGLSGLTGPKTAVRGNRIAAVGMAIAVIATLLVPTSTTSVLDHPRRGDRHRGRRAGGAPGQDDPDAADGRAVQRRRRRRGRADRVGRVPRVRRLCRRRRPTSRSSAASRRSSARVSFWGSNIAFAKLQELIDGKPVRPIGSAQTALVNGAAGADRGRLRRRDRRRLARRDPDHRAAGHRGARSATSSCCRSAAPTCRSSSRLLNAFTGLSAAATGVALNNTVADRRGHDRRRLGHAADPADGRWR